MIYKKEIKIENKLCPLSLSKIFEDISFEHLAYIDCSEETLLKKNLTWIISSLKYQIID